MRRRLPANALLTALIAGAAPQRASSHGIQGELAQSSRATINIQVSVLPHFGVTAAGNSTLVVSSNAPRLRYDVRIEPNGGAYSVGASLAKAPTPRIAAGHDMDVSAMPSSGNFVLLVVPD